MFHPSHTSFGWPCLRRTTVDMVHESHFVSQFVARDVSSPSLQKFQLSERKILLRQHSSSLTVVFLTKQRESRFSLVHLLHVWCCPPAQSQSVYTFTNGVNLLISIKQFALQTPFRYLAMRFTFISIALCRTRDLSCCFLHAVHDVSTLLAHVQQLSHGYPLHGSLLVLQLNQ